MANTQNADLTGLRVAIVHYWFVGRAGGERVVEAIADIFPQADLYCLIADRDTLAANLKARVLHTSFLQKIPWAKRFHRHLLFLQPIALEQFDLTGYDLVISSESGPAKGVITSSRTCHICYCHSPMRYIWEMYPQYKGGMNPVVSAVFSLTAHYLRMWDYASAARVDYFVANSRFIASRIRKVYRRDSTVIHPPVETSTDGIDATHGDYYLAVGRLVDYKRFDLAVSACTRLGKVLRVVGDGPEIASLRRIAGPTITFLGKTSDRILRENMAGCRALIFPGEEDFGIVPIEAQSFGKPVIAFASGGALETVRGIDPSDGTSQYATGVFFYEQSVDAVSQAIIDFELRENSFSPARIREHSLQFDRKIFQQRFEEYVCAAMLEFKSKNL
jgi:glycosyltransferase involved in cell wall biosynthesis